MLYMLSWDHILAHPQTREVTDDALCWRCLWHSMFCPYGNKVYRILAQKLDPTKVQDDVGRYWTYTHGAVLWASLLTLIPFHIILCITTLNIVYKTSQD
jgi:hypothetical protein